QAEKAIVDVGAGAGAQSRAADTHLILRPHEDDGVAVLEAAVRSFKPIEPISLRWQFPLWHVDGDADPALLRGRLNKSEERKLERDKESRDKILAALLKGPQSVRHLRGIAGAGPDRCNRLLDGLEVDGAIEWEPTVANGGKQRIYRIKNEGGL